MSLSQVHYLPLAPPFFFILVGPRMLQAVSHATAKAAMFMSAGLIYAALGHDRLVGLGGIAQVALSGAALIALPPSGAYLAKELLLAASAQTGQWWWAIVIQSGGMLTSSYVLLVLAHALAPASRPVASPAPIPRSSEAAALALAICSLLLGLVRWDAYLPVPRVTLPNPVALGTLLTGRSGQSWEVLCWRSCWGAGGIWGGGASPRPSPTHGPCLGKADRAPRWQRQWPVATVSLLLVAIFLGAALMAAR
jgi:formate hydrogenlyase subunit 3/multisubunit Na+/H+ antiporter MnhD subunit